MGREAIYFLRLRNDDALVCVPSSLRGLLKVIPMNILVRGADEFARTLKTSCSYKLFLLFSTDS